MDFSYLSFLVILIFRCIVLCSQSDSFSTLHPNGVAEPGVISLNKSEQKSGPADREGILLNLKENITEKAVHTFSKDMVIQVGAFHQELKALTLRNWLSHMVDMPVVIVSENGYFKVRITGLTSMQEMERLIPLLGLLGIKKLWAFQIRDKEEIKNQVVVLPDTSLKIVENKIELPVIAEEKPVLAESTFDLQVGVFYRRSKALRAQRRITTKLNMPVKIVKEWEYYIVFITGFKTREEIFKYYPKLAALGYPDNYMIENKKESQTK